MPKLAKELQALEVKRLEHPRKHSRPVFIAVGGVKGLQIQITPMGAKSWVLRYVPKNGGKRRHMGLGAYPEITLAMARDKARVAREAIDFGHDPVNDRRAARVENSIAQRRTMTFRYAMDRYLSTKLQEFKNEKHAKQWAATLHAYAIPELGDMPTGEIEVQDILRVLNPIWYEKTETAKRLRGRIEHVLAWATVNGHRTGDNPARWKGNLDTSLPKPSTLKGDVHYPCVAQDDLQDWFANLWVRDGISARALEFTALTAARSGETRGATWDQIDLESRTWNRPAHLMKMKRKHAVALSDACIDLLHELPRLSGNQYVFPAPRGGKLTDMALSAVMRRIHEAKLEEDGKGYIDVDNGRAAVPHGLRASFKTWATESTDFPRELAEFALAHKVGDDTEAAYQRGAALERRRLMAKRWADHLLDGNKETEIIKLHG